MSKRDAAVYVRAASLSAVLCLAACGEPRPPPGHTAYDICIYTGDKDVCALAAAEVWAKTASCPATP